MITKQTIDSAKRIELAKLRLVKGIRRHTEQSIQLLAGSMAGVGQLSPVGVFPPDEDGFHDLLMGYGRVHAAERLGWTHIEAKQFPLESDHGKALRMQVSENEVRKAMNFLEQWDVIFQYAQETGQQIQTAGQELGFAQSTISKIDKCNRRVSDCNKKALVEAQVGFTKVFELSQAEEPLQSELVRRTIAEGLTREQIRDEIKPTILDLRKYDYQCPKGKLQVAIPRSADAAQLMEVVKEFASELNRLLKQNYSTATLAQILKEQSRVV